MFQFQNYWLDYNYILIVSLHGKLGRFHFGLYGFTIKPAFQEGGTEFLFSYKCLNKKLVITQNMVQKVLQFVILNIS